MKAKILALLLLGLLAGCAASSDSAGPNGDSAANGAAPEPGAEAQSSTDEEATTESRTSLEEASVPPLQAAPPPRQRNGDEPERFNVSARQVPIRDLILGLVEDTEYSAVVDPEVEGEVTLNLRQVTLPQALNYLSRTYGYGIERINNRFLVRPADLQTRTFEVDYLDVKREGDSQTQISSGQVTQNPIQSDGGGGGGEERNIIGTNVETETQSQFWGQLRQGLEAILEGDPTGKSRLVMHPGAGVVLVRAMPKVLHDVADYLEQVQGGSHRQVVIQAKVLEVQLTDEHESGINWATLGRAGEAEIATSQIDPGLDNQGSDFQALGTNTTSPTLLPQLQGVDPGGFFSAAIAMDDFSAMLNLLETQGDVDVLSSPRVATVNNQKAVIKVGVDEFFLTDVDLRNTGTVGTAATTQQNFDVELTPFFDGIALDVTPQISQQGMVTMHVHPSVTEVTSQTKEFQFSQDQVFQFPLARSDVQETDTIVRAEDGQIVVIGGLMKESTNANRTQVPVLGDIPGVGYLFSSRDIERVKRELVILLRPRVVYGQDMDQAREEDLEKLWEEGVELSRPDD